MTIIEGTDFELLVDIVVAGRRVSSVNELSITGQHVFSEFGRAQG